MTVRTDDLATLRQLSPITRARAEAFRVMTRHPDCLLDDVPLDELLEDIAQAILKGVPAGGEQR